MQHDNLSTDALTQRFENEREQINYLLTSEYPHTETDVEFLRGRAKGFDLAIARSNDASSAAELIDHLADEAEMATRALQDGGTMEYRQSCLGRRSAFSTAKRLARRCADGSGVEATPEATI